MLKEEVYLVPLLLPQGEELPHNELWLRAIEDLSPLSVLLLKELRPFLGYRYPCAYAREGGDDAAGTLKGPLSKRDCRGVESLQLCYLM